MESLVMNTERPEIGELGPVIFEKQAVILQDQLDDAIAKGA
jgi:hypothetical protein